MNSLNQGTSESSTAYDPNVAFEFFKLFGELESVKAGKNVFVQGQKAGFLSFWQVDKMYFLVEGKVTIQTTSGNVINVEAGEIFGELMLYTTSNATATATISCKLLSLSEKQLEAGLKKKPEFLYMLIDAFVKYVQKADTETKDSRLLAENKNLKKDGALNTTMLDDLKQQLGEEALMVIPEKRIIFHEGAAASLMYVILEGYVTIIVDNKVVGRSGPGDIVGEIALVVHQHSRTANVVAETNCLLLAINRQTLLELIQTLPAFGISLLRVLAAHFHIRRTTAR